MEDDEDEEVSAEVAASFEKAHYNSSKPNKFPSLTSGSLATTNESDAGPPKLVEASNHSSGGDGGSNRGVLELSFRKIRRIENLFGRDIVSLRLDNNSLEKIENIGHLGPTLLSLDLSFNRITEMEGLERLFRLRSLSLCCNGIAAVRGLDSCVDLVRLSLGGNALGSGAVAAARAYLGPFRGLRSLTVAGNPGCPSDAGACRAEFLADVPQLEYFDGVRVRRGEAAAVRAPRGTAGPGALRRSLREAHVFFTLTFADELAARDRLRALPGGGMHRRSLYLAVGFSASVLVAERVRLGAEGAQEMREGLRTSRDACTAAAAAAVAAYSELRRGASGRIARGDGGGRAEVGRLRSALSELDGEVMSIESRRAQLVARKSEATRGMGVARTSCQTKFFDRVRGWYASYSTRMLSLGIDRIERGLDVVLEADNVDNSAATDVASDETTNTDQDAITRLEDFFLLEKKRIESWIESIQEAQLKLEEESLQQIHVLDDEEEWQHGQKRMVGLEEFIAKAGQDLDELERLCQ